MANGTIYIFNRREKQSLERYLKDVPTVEEHQKLNKTISFNQTKISRVEALTASQKLPFQGLKNCVRNWKKSNILFDMKALLYKTA